MAQNFIEITVNSFKAVLDKHKDFFPIVVVIPAFLGGCWQLLELSLIDVSYIRFFSLTQMVPDGLILLFICLILFLFLKFFIYSIDSIGYDLEENLEETTVYSRMAISIFMALLGIIHLLLRVRGYNDEITFIEVLLRFSNIFGGLFCLFYAMVMLVILYKFKEPGILDTEKIKDLSKMPATYVAYCSLIFAISVPYFLSIIFTTISLRNAVLIPQNLINKEILDKKIKTTISSNNFNLLQ